jgi:large subunit ribosomal protein L2
MVAGRDGAFVIIRMKSGETRMVPAACLASVGAVSNPDHLNEIVGKAGRNRWKGFRPVSRGIARNPVDHPNGGRTNGGKHWATPWGKPTKGKKTRTNKRTTKFIVRSRHDRKKTQ